VSSKETNLKSKGTLYIVATPLGNLADITFRAIETLKSVDYIACEDTRQSKKLLNHYDIHTKVFSFYSYNEEKQVDKVLDMLALGKNIALVSDGGTPLISDPGYVLVNKARELGFTIVPIPGPSAISILLSVAGIPQKGVRFLGFLSPKPGKRRKRLKESLEEESGLVIFESPHRVLKLLQDLADIAPDAHVLVGREMTKLHEEFLAGTAREVLTKLQEREKVLGEFSLFVTLNKKA
jgi:16S rRNA (cytidine1402-2'-O)-methyltransferase